MSANDNKEGAAGLCGLLLGALLAGLFCSIAGCKSGEWGVYERAIKAGAGHYVANPETGAIGFQWNAKVSP
jgi:hypothetical protein